MGGLTHWEAVNVYVFRVCVCACVRVRVRVRENAYLAADEKEDHQADDHLKGGAGDRSTGEQGYRGARGGGACGPGERGANRCSTRPRARRGDEKPAATATATATVTATAHLDTVVGHLRVLPVGPARWAPLQPPFRFRVGPEPDQQRHREHHDRHHKVLYVQRFREYFDQRHKRARYPKRDGVGPQPRAGRFPMQFTGHDLAPRVGDGGPHAEEQEQDVQDDVGLVERQRRQQHRDAQQTDEHHVVAREPLVQFGAENGA